MIRIITLPLIIAFAGIGCSGSGDADAGKLGQSLGQNVTEFAKGVGSGVDSQLQIKIELSEALTSAGVTATVAKQQTPLNAPEKSIVVYFISTNAVKGTFVAKAYNSDEQEIGRAAKEAEFKVDDAQYVGFEFPPEMDRQTVSVYRIDFREMLAEGNAN